MIQLGSLTNTTETFSITAIVDSALCVGAGGSSGSLADKPILRNAENNLIIPASQVKGRLRHECEKIARGLGWQICQAPAAGMMRLRREEVEAAENGYLAQFKQDQYKVPNYPDTYHCLVSQIFGDPILPSRIILDDLVCEENPENLPEVLRPGVSINRRRRTAEDQKLFFLETSPANAQLRFTGKLYILPSYTPNLVDYAKALIWAGFQHIQALGGSKSAGLGWLHWELPPIGQVSPEVWSFLAQEETA
ncbi:RAMP superfamily CRISPR-associated protein [Leptothoe sp. LEGE 181152]|nr:RAMP superfamily CRISPR-associated protein [Leptothoe sp. LEGE 181152]